MYIFPDAHYYIIVVQFNNPYGCSGNLNISLTKVKIASTL